MEPVKLDGWLPDPPKAEDWDFCALKPRLPAPRAGGDHVLTINTPVSNQGMLRSCAANSTADALEILMGQRGQVTQLSRLFIYYNARNYHSAASADGGTYLRMAFEAIKKLGVCPESMWAYNEANVNLRPPLGAYRAANDNKVTGFYRITRKGEDRLADIEAALRADHPVAFGTQVSPEFIEYKGERDAAFRTPPEEKFKGRHAMLICGIRRHNGRRELWTRNSWGPTWGLGGYFWMDEGYVMSPITSDLWVPTLMPALA